MSLARLLLHAKGSLLIPSRVSEVHGEHYGCYLTSHSSAATSAFWAQSVIFTGSFSHKAWHEHCTGACALFKLLGSYVYIQRMLNDDTKPLLAKGTYCRSSSSSLWEETHNSNHNLPSLEEFVKLKVSYLWLKYYNHAVKHSPRLKGFLFVAWWLQRAITERCQSITRAKTACQCKQQTSIYTSCISCPVPPTNHLGSTHH